MAFALAQKSKKPAPLQAKRGRARKQAAGLYQGEQGRGAGVVGFGQPFFASVGAPVIQAKLKIGEPDDQYEKEADRAADEVMRMPDPMATGAPMDTGVSDSGKQLGNGSFAIQRMCTDCAMKEDPLQRKPVANTPAPPRISALNGPVATHFPLANRPSVVQRMDDEDYDGEMVQMKSADGGSAVPTVTPGVEAGINSLKGGGRPLSESARAFFEPRFGVDFRGVRVHADGRAALATKSVQAKAFTTGRDVVFGAGEYSPDALAGRKLLAHELTHVMQQHGGLTFFSAGKNSDNTIPNFQESSIVPPVFPPAQVKLIQREDAEMDEEEPVQAQLIQRTPDDLTEKARYPTKDEQQRILEILNPQQQAAAAEGLVVDEVTDREGFRRDMKNRMEAFINKLLLPAKERQKSLVILGETAIEALADVVQPEVENFYRPYLEAAVHMSEEQERRAGFQLREHTHLVPETPSAETDFIACHWVVDRMQYRGSDIIEHYNVLMNAGVAKGNCSLADSPDTVPQSDSGRDQELFESVRDEILDQRREDLRTIIIFQSSFHESFETESGEMVSGGTFIQSHMRSAPGDANEQETRRRGRWETLGTIIHEMLHAVAHEAFRRGVAPLERSGIAVEGFADYFALPVYNSLRDRAEQERALRTSIEGVETEEFDRSLAPDSRVYEDRLNSVKEIVQQILGGNVDSLKAAYFLGRMEYIGLGGWNAREAERRRRLRFPANVLGFGVLVIEDGPFYRLDYSRVVFGRGGDFQVQLGGGINYLTEGNYLGLGATAAVQYSGKHLYVRGEASAVGSTSVEEPFESRRLDVIPGFEVGARIGMVRVGSGVHWLFPVKGDVDERTGSAGWFIGLSIER